MNSVHEGFTNFRASWPVRGDVSGREITAAAFDFAGPPILVGLIDHGYKVATAELELASLLRCKVVKCSNDELDNVTTLM